MELEYNVDLVYLWCDGSDPKFQQKKLEVLKNFNEEKLNSEAISNCRFVETEELKYSLRSIEKFAPWIRNIYIITDDQVPKWLNTNNPKIKVINHKELIPAKYLPTFNSMAIEVFLPLIPGLSEHFLFANDDMFLWDYVEKDFFFNEKGAPICRVIPRKAKQVHSLYGTTIDNGYKLILEKFNKNIMYWPHHGIDSYRKSDFLECISHFKEAFEQTASHKFRELSDIQRMTVSYYAIAQKDATIREIEQEKWYNFFRVKEAKDSLYTGCLVRKMKKFKNKNGKLFCINDCKKTTDKDRLYMKQLLEEKFPQKSAYEI